MINRIVICLALLFISCHKKQTAYLIIENSSRDQRAVRLSVSIDTASIFDQVVEYSDISPDLRYTPSAQLDKGKYVISVVADNGNLVKKQQINLDNDRWIFISYLYEAPADSSTLSRLALQYEKEQEPSLEYIDKLKRGSKPEINIHVMDKEPMHH